MEWKKMFLEALRPLMNRCITFFLLLHTSLLCAIKRGTSTLILLLLPLLWFGKNNNGPSYWSLEGEGEGNMVVFDDARKKKKGKRNPLLSLRCIDFSRFFRFTSFHFRSFLPRLFGNKKIIFVGTQKALQNFGMIKYSLFLPKNPSDVTPPFTSSLSQRRVKVSFYLLFFLCFCLIRSKRFLSPLLLSNIVFDPLWNENEWMFCFCVPRYRSSLSKSFYKKTQN